MPSADRTLWSIILPVHNQADHLERMVDDHLGTLDRLGFPYELLLVTNGCRDTSPAIASRLAAERPSVRWIDLGQGGWGRAVQAGLREAKGDVLCFANSARTSPETLAVHLAYARAYPDAVVKANRKVRESLRRRLGSLIYNLECRALFDLACWDINGTPKVFPRRYQRLLELSRDDDLIDLEFVATCRRESYPVIEVPIVLTQRIGGASTTNYRSAARMYVGAWALRRAAGDPE